MKKSILFTVVSAATFFALEANAQMGGGGERGERPQMPEFAEVDTDGSETVTLVELQAAIQSDRPNLAETLLSRRDTDEDGALSAEEYATRPEGRGDRGSH